ncbi:MAG: pyridoxamine 5'-phosphate oxidase family protein [Defluviitaleaceae bacterium]|nr:pyridoxamine 5'-phosphate oxidase family protein [Defluviitaleaceae bacterium]
MDIIAKAAKIVEQNSIKGGEFKGQVCVLSLIDAEGFPTASVLTPSKSEGINWLTLCTMLDGNGVKRIANCNRASVCFSGEYCVNLVGEVEVITSPEVKREMWYDGLSCHFTGSDDPNYCVLKFTTKRYKLCIDGEEVEGML